MAEVVRRTRWWIVALVATGAGVLLYFHGATEVRAAPSATPPTGPQRHPCLRGEGMSAPKAGGDGSCYYCRPPRATTTPSDDDPPPWPSYEPSVGVPATPPGANYGSVNLDAGTDGGGGHDAPGSGGVLSHSGSFTAVTILPVGGEPFG